ncbi:tetraacyldisaccharide 4'-kinase, partial [bacterium]|nr:tetraacyldisaccharide 4'-kinase [bacterium]
AAHNCFDENRGATEIIVTELKKRGLFAPQPSHSDRAPCRFPTRLKAAILCNLDPGLCENDHLRPDGERKRTLEDALASLILFMLKPASIIYFLAATLRASLYERKGARSYRPPCPTICVGNLTTGGSGKSPTVILICELLIGMGLRPVILSRGYRRTERNLLAIAPGPLEYANSLESLAKFGDEAMMFRSKLPQVPIVIGSDRAAAAKEACDTFKPDVLVMDDGFGHLRLKRDLDILMFDARYPFGNKKLLPCGMLREPLSAISRAKVAILSHMDEADPREVQKTEEAIRSRNPDIAILHSRHSPVSMRQLSGEEELPLNSLSGKRVLAFCGIAHPDKFFKLLGNCGAIVTGVGFPDHHAFSTSELRDIFAQSQTGDYDFIVTTEKDAPRLGNLSPHEARRVLVLRIELSLVGRSDAEQILSIIRGVAGQDIRPCGSVGSA